MCSLTRPWYTKGHEPRTLSAEYHGIKKDNARKRSTEPILCRGMLRRFLYSSALITALFCLQELPKALATGGCNGYGSFYDNWGCSIHYTAVEWLHSKGFAEGEDPKSSRGNMRAFYGSRPINRAEFTKLVLLVAGYKNQLPACTEDPFPDVLKDEWFAPYICAAKIRNIVSGFPDGMFHPSRNITYASAAKILVTAFNIEFVPDTEVWYRPFVKALSALDALSPTIESFDQMISRGEMAEMLYRLGNDGDPYVDSNISNSDSAWQIALWYGGRFGYLYLDTRSTISFY